MSERFKIEKGVEVPALYLERYKKNYEGKNHGGPAPIYPFGEMVAGDSFAILNPRVTKSIKVASAGYARRHGGRYIVTLDDGKQWRCWKVE